MTRTLHLLATLLLLAPAIAAEAPYRTETNTYVGGWTPGTYSREFFPDCTSQSNVAGACFAPQEGEGAVTLSLKDGVAARVCAIVKIISPSQTHHREMCDESLIPLPPGASSVRVKVILSAHVQPELSGPPTQGTITARFYTAR